MKLSEYLGGMRQAETAVALEAAIQAPHQHCCIGRTWRRICNVRIAAGTRICEAHPNGQFVPRLGPRRRLALCGQTHRVAVGGNSTGARCTWSCAEDWTRDILLARGFSKRAAHAIWSWAFDYPHRALQCVEDAFAGELPDPPLNELTFQRTTLDGTPVTIDRDEEAPCRAHRPCPCDGEGWLWDWGAGWTGYAYYVTWYCDRCPRVFGEYRADLAHRRTPAPVSPALEVASAGPGEPERGRRDAG